MTIEPLLGVQNTDAQLWIDLTVIGAAALGTFARTMLPYWAKLVEMPEMVFDRKFLGTAVISFIAALGLGLGLFPMLSKSIDVTSMSLAGIFAVVAIMAFGLNQGINWGIDQVKPSTTTTAATTPTPTPTPTDPPSAP
jgi:hypothetical protein